MGFNSAFKGLRFFYFKLTNNNVCKELKVKYLRLVINKWKFQIHY